MKIKNLILLAVALCAAAVSSLQAASVTVAWTDNSSGELGFKIERAPGTAPVDSAFVVVGTVAANTTVFIDSTVQAATTYSYRIRAYDATQYSAYSNVATGTTPAALPAPGGATVTPTLLLAITLNPSESITVRNSLTVNKPGSKTFNIPPGTRLVADASK